MKVVELTFDEGDGALHFIHSDEAAEFARGLATDARLDIRRASHVEPTPDGRWSVDLTPVGGPASLGEPFLRRADALAAEVAWLQSNLGL